MQNIKKISCLSLLFFGLIISSCKKKDKNEEEESTFQKSEILENLADNWIAPNLNELVDRINTLETNWNNFVSNNSSANFDATKNAWKEAYLSFQKVKFIDFGPAMNIGFQGALGTFPADTVNIENNIASGSYDLSTISNAASVGFAALDFLFYHVNAYDNIINSQNRRTYILALIQKMQSEAQYMKTNWASYRSGFVAGTGTSSTDAFSQLVNAFCKEFELFKTAKLGIPIGKLSLGITRPEYIEARYSSISFELMIENMKSLRAVFLGQGIDGTNGKGFDDYLVALDKSSLSGTIQTRFDEIINRPQTWIASFENMMNSNLSALDDYYNYITQTVVYLKTDMSSAFGILITYQDNDGD